MKEVNDGIAAVLIFRITGRKVHSNVAIGGVALKVAFEEFSVDSDVFDSTREGSTRSLVGGSALRAKQAPGAD